MPSEFIKSRQRRWLLNDFYISDGKKIENQRITNLVGWQFLRRLPDFTLFRPTVAKQDDCDQQQAIGP